MDTVHPPDGLPPGKYPYAQNVRARLREAVAGRPLQDSSLEKLDSSVHSLRRLNDSTPAGPPGGFILVGGATTNLYANAVIVDSGLSGNPISLLPFRPSASVQPWMYVGDSIKMDKVRSDGTTYKMGVKEPQVAPVVTSIPVPTISAIGLVGPVTITFWGDSPHSGPVAAYIWRNPNDTGWGPIWNSRPPAGVTTGNSLLLDPGAIGNQDVPMEWVTYVVYVGNVNTNGTDVQWVSGDQFGGIPNGASIVIGSTVYTVSTVNSPTDITLTGSAGIQNDVHFDCPVRSGFQAVFGSPLEPQGFSDFNFILEATLYVPAAGTYTLNLDSKDDCMWGIGDIPTGKATWPAATGGQTYSLAGQTKTAKNGYKLIPRLEGHSSGGNHPTASIAVTFSAPGNYPFEIDYDYWFHSGRTLTINVNGVELYPIPGAVISDSQYRYTYRGSATGATSNPSPESPIQVLSVVSNSIVATPSTDPQVDKIDFYRLDKGLTNFTYVGTGPNSSAPFVDELLDVDISANPILQFDNYEPFPSIDLPRKGIVNVDSTHVATWVSGDQFNVRWLAGTIIIVGTLAYTLDKRPTDSTHLTAIQTQIVGGVTTIVPLAQGTGLPYEIAEPILAAQPLPYIWGPTDNINFAFGVGDPLRPGTLYWCKGSNLDAAPDTNQEDVTSPSEPLQNGCIVNGNGMVFSTERAWLIYPNFFNALATVQGTVGSQWTLQESISTRGLYIPRGLAVDGGGNVFFRAKDGVYISPGGQGAKSITDDDLYNLFPHEGFVPQPVARGGYTAYPPDDRRPQDQRMNVANGYLYYDYLDTNGSPRTLVYDIIAHGWVVDEYEHPATLHILEEGVVNGVLVGCVDGDVRPLTNTGKEKECAVLLTPAADEGDTRAEKHFGDLYIEAGTEGS